MKMKKVENKRLRNKLKKAADKLVQTLEGKVSTIDVTNLELIFAKDLKKEDLVFEIHKERNSRLSSSANQEMTVFTIFETLTKISDWVKIKSIDPEACVVALNIKNGETVTYPFDSLKDRYFVRVLV